MRFIGNKESIVSEIRRLLNDKGVIGKKLSFFDAFCGTGSVGDHFKSDFDIILNDNLKWAVIYSIGRLCAGSCTFEMLGFDPIDYFNHNHEVVQGFMYHNYAPTNTSRMYFTPENAQRIDYFRQQIETWTQEGKLSYNEYCYLLACLIESVSSVSNTAGVYGAYLKKWDARAKKVIEFVRVPSSTATSNKIVSHNDKLENIIENIDCDILYLDPPYTQNQYGTQYHLLETLVLNDNPEISPITGSRSTAPMRSDWSKDYKVHILLDKIVAKTKARYIVLSYTNDGFMSKSFIEAVLKRYGKPETYVCRKIVYKKYQNWKSCNNQTHYEYLFFVEKKPDEEVVYESPLNYIGNKARVLPQIRQHMALGVESFIDAFGGGFNVGINMNAKQIVYNDNNPFVVDLIRSFRDHDTYEYLMYIRKMTGKFGLKKADKDAYIAARDYYNSLPLERRDSQ